LWVVHRLLEQIWVLFILNPKYMLSRLPLYRYRVGFGFSSSGHHDEVSAAFKTFAMRLLEFQEQLEHNNLVREEMKKPVKLKTLVGHPESIVCLYL